MKKIIVLSIILLGITGCKTDGEALTKEDIKTRCIGGVGYYLFTGSNGYRGFGFMSPKFNRDGKVSLCNGGKYEFNR